MNPLLSDMLPMLMGFAYDLIYLGLALLLIVMIGFPSIKFMVGRSYNLRIALFEDDNPVAGFEIAGKILMLFYLVHCMVQGESVGGLGQDLLITSAAVAISILGMVLARWMLGVFVDRHNQGKDLNHEIFRQHNWAAACMSLALDIGIVNGITEEDVLGVDPWRDFGLCLVVMLLGIGVVWLYRFTHMRGRDYMKTFFTDDNPAAGISLLGFALAANLISYTAGGVAKLMELTLLPAVGFTLVFSTVMLLLLVSVRWLLEQILKRMWKHHIPREIFDQQSVGAGLLDAGIMLGIASVLTVTVA